MACKARSATGEQRSGRSLVAHLAALGVLGPRLSVAHAIWISDADIAQLAGRCRFRDCRHEDEPGCAVRGQVPPERLKNYNKLLREARRDSITALERKVQVQQWKARSRHARIRAEGKRG